MSGQSAPAALSDPGAFSYAVLDPDAEAIARDAAEIIHGVQKAFTLEVGRQLLRAKDILPHGAFERWVQDVLDMKPRTARNHMNAARWLHGKPATVADLPPTVLYALSAPSAPAEVVQLVVDAAAAGEPLNAGAIEMQIHTAKHADAELKAAQRRTPGITREKLAANKVKGDQKWKAQQERETEERARAERETEERMRPLAAAILACPGDVATMLEAVLSHHWTDREVLRALLEAGLREKGQ